MCAAAGRTTGGRQRKQEREEEEREKSGVGKGWRGVGGGLEEKRRGEEERKEGIRKGVKEEEEEEKEEKEEAEEEEEEEEVNEEGKYTVTETVVGGLLPFLELQCTLILLLMVQSTMSLNMAGRILEKFLYTSTRHPSLGRGNSVKNRHYHVL